MKHSITFILAASFIAGCATDPTTDPAPVDPIDKTVCWDGVTLPRPALEPAPLASVAAKYAAYNDALATYQAAADQFSVESAAHAAAFDAVAAQITGKLCSTDVDCSTGSTSFVGVCVHPYYGVGARCYVSDAAPLTGPQPPPTPVITCADLSCAALTNYACETEANTGTNACILSRCGNGGGGGGGGGGRPTH